MIARNPLYEAIDRLPSHTSDLLRMENLIDPALAALPELLVERHEWLSMYIDYEPPHLMRMYRPIMGKCRTAHISLHYFFGNSVDEGKNNYHPHSWATAFHIFSGGYQQQIGLATAPGYAPELQPAPHTTQEQSAGSRYAFNDPLIWHRIIPDNKGPVSTMMLTYIPEGWNQTGPKPQIKQRELTADELDFMFTHFQDTLTERKVA